MKTKLRFSQAWIDRVTSEPTGDLTHAGHGFDAAPHDSEVLNIFRGFAGEDAVREMVRRKWFATSTNGDKQSARAQGLFDFVFAGRGLGPEFASATLFRRQRADRSLLVELVTHVWLLKVRDKALEAPKLPFESKKLNQESISQLVKLSPQKDGPCRAIQFLEALGVRVILESSLPGMRTDGASFFVPDRGPVIALTLRYDRLDSFWFTLLHEIAHITLHITKGNGAVFVDSLEDEERGELEVEAEADAFAMDSFVPRDAWQRSDAYKVGTEAAIVALANKHEIHPAVVAGRLRFEKKRYWSHADLLGNGQVRELLLAE
jgi:HTH-type transcriptional regulator / antitoxin HigA